MQYDQKSFAIEQHYRLRRTLPRGLQDLVDSEPELETFEGFYLRAYWNLATERGAGSAIPWSKIVEYGERSGLDSSMIDVLVTVIRHLEAAHSRWAKGEHEKQKLVDGPSPAKRAKSMSKRRG